MKRLFALLTAIAIVFFGSSFAFADEVDESIMKKHVEDFLAEEHYDFHKGTVQLADVEPINVNDPDGKVSEVWASFVTYETKRDDIFTFEHTDVVYYDVTNETVLSATDAGKFQPLTDYRDNYEGKVGKKMSTGPILLLLSLLLLVPAYLVFVWSKQRYSTTDFIIKNNIYNQTQSFN